MNTILEKLREKNPRLDIKPITDTAFAKYGQIHKDIKTDEFIKRVLDYVDMSNRRVSYEASIPELESDREFLSEVERKVYGEMPVQIGLCYGWNSKLNGVEYHKGNELTVAVTDLILLLGDFRDIQFGKSITYDSSNIEAFYVSKGTVFELYSWTLHYAALHVEDSTGFIAVIVLPRGTNEPLQHEVERSGENRLLAAVNKWLILHPEAGQSGYIGLMGENIEVVSL